MGTVTQPWTLSEKIVAMNMAGKGHTALEIARELKKTRNAVIGYCNRNEIQLGAKSKPPRRVKKEKVIKIKVERVEPPPPQQLEIFVFDENQYKTFKDVSWGECKSIIGDANGINTKYCARPVMKAGCSWCEEHFKLYYTYKKVATNGNKQNYSRNDRLFAKARM